MGLSPAILIRTVTYDKDSRNCHLGSVIRQHCLDIQHLEVKRGDVLLEAGYMPMLRAHLGCAVRPAEASRLLPLSSTLHTPRGTALPPASFKSGIL